MKSLEIHAGQKGKMHSSMQGEKLKVIYVMSHPPAYDAYEEVKDTRPRANWDTADGQWVGIWGYEWADLLGNSILANVLNVDFEVWQPDPRADKVYSHRFENNLCHRLFPARVRHTLYKPVIYSREILEQLEREQKEHRILIQTDVVPQLHWLVRPNRHLKIIGTYHGSIQLPGRQIFRLRKNVLRYFSLFFEQRALNSFISDYSLITYQNDANLDDLKSIYKGHIRKITMGVDFGLFRPLDKQACRSALGLPPDKKIFLTVGRMNELKQNDKVIEAFAALDDAPGFLLIMVGRSDSPGYMDRLRKLAGPLAASNKVLFTGYKRGEELVRYYNAADLFIMSSTNEGGPVTSMEAIACEAPVLSTRTGYVAELLESHGRGRLTGTRDYGEWADIIAAYLKGDLEIPLFNRETAKAEFSWEAIAGKFAQVYQLLAEEQG